MSTKRSASLRFRSLSSSNIGGNFITRSCAPDPGGNFIVTSTSAVPKHTTWNPRVRRPPPPREAAWRGDAKTRADRVRWSRARRQVWRRPRPRRFPRAKGPSWFHLPRPLACEPPERWRSRRVLPRWRRRPRTSNGRIPGQRKCGSYPRPLVQAPEKRRREPEPWEPRAAAPPAAWRRTSPLPNCWKVAPGDRAKRRKGRRDEAAGGRAQAAPRWGRGSRTLRRRKADHRGRGRPG